MRLTKDQQNLVRDKLSEFEWKVWQRIYVFGPLPFTDLLEDEQSADISSKKYTRPFAFMYTVLYIGSSSDQNNQTRTRR